MGKMREINEDLSLCWYTLTLLPAMVETIVRVTHAHK